MGVPVEKMLRRKRTKWHLFPANSRKQKGGKPGDLPLGRGGGKEERMFSRSKNSSREKKRPRERAQLHDLSHNKKG